MGTKKAEDLSDREQAGLRGPVKVCTEETVYGAADSFPERKVTTNKEFDRDGRLLSTRTTNANGPDWVANYAYDAAGHLLSVSSGLLGRESVESVYSYDDNGRLLRVANPRSGSRSEYHYDQEGRKIELRTPEPRSQGGAVAFGGGPFAAAQVGFGAPQGGSFKIIYNERDVATEVQTLDVEGHVVSRVVRTFDEDGRVLGEKQVFENFQFIIPPEQRAKAMAESGLSAEALAAELDKQLRATLGADASFFASSSKYDAQGRLVEVRSRMGPDSERIVTTAYNERGDIATETNATTWQVNANNGGATNAAGPALPPERFAHRYDYTYDSFGNWTERVTKLSSKPGEPFTNSSTTRRTITYY